VNWRAKARGLGLSGAHLNITRTADLEALSQAAADDFVDRAGDAVAQRGRFMVALTGGSTPRRMYELLAEAPRRDRIDWTRVHFFWGDDRAVPPDHPDSNFRLANETLLSKLSLGPDQVHRIPAELGARDAACAYDVTLAELFEAAPPNWPRFDLVLLGMGSDGHVASLFPGYPTLDLNDTLVTSSPPGTLPPPVDRITVTMPVLNAARAVVFVVDGADKAPALTRALAGDPEVPAGRVRPTEGELRWFVDEPAGSEVPSDAHRQGGA
jgi:6-phosphogluconolactonase